ILHLDVRSCHGLRLGGAAALRVMDGSVPMLDAPAPQAVPGPSIDGQPAPPVPTRHVAVPRFVPRALALVPKRRRQELGLVHCLPLLDDGSLEEIFCLPFKVADSRRFCSDFLWRW